MRLLLPCFSSLVLLLFLFFPTNAQAGDLWKVTNPETQLDFRAPHCQFVQPLWQATTGVRSESRSQPGLITLVRDTSTATWNFDYQPQATASVTGLKPHVRPAIFRKTKDMLLRSVCGQSTILPGSFQRQLGFTLIQYAHPIERATAFYSQWNAEFALNWSRLTSVDLAAAFSPSAPKSISIPTSWKRDNYWGFYSDCDRWDVRLHELELQPRTPWSVLQAIPSRAQIEQLLEPLATILSDSILGRFAKISAPDATMAVEQF